MSAVSIRAALETALNSMSPALATAWENIAYTPTPGTAYQRVNLLMARPENAETGPRYLERGFMQVTLSYPLNTGPAAAATRAELIRSTFYRTATFTSGGVTVSIDQTPEVAPAMIEGDRYEVPVRVYFFAPIG
jgi:hypothetical protein